ncbi:ISL3 family transposase [Azospirillum sp. B21]|uniref:ISL3 family transposase n=1 Tax=Azospirillum sp. B21 TaxID=2607496 RepID=UPI0011EFB86A|nr:ISL3 family transposase [Azospirillum sp. B21]KAA0571656.1 ISL3 family transposase [Azospirillum sp. B21]
MAQSLRCTGCVPPGFVIVETADSSLAVQITVRSAAAFSPCPVCGEHSFRMHSRYQRLLFDLPLSGRNVRLHLQARRFHCDVPTCRRRIFAERFDPDVLKPWARRTARLDDPVYHLGLALGGRPAARLGKRLMVPITKDTPLRAMLRHNPPVFPPPSTIGIDDWAWWRNQRYRTLICDLDRHRTIALLPNREPATTEEWLSDQQQVAIVARDRSGAYPQAILKALPHAIQVADRWHLMENASHAFLDAVRKSMRQIRVAIGAATVDPTLLTAAEHIQYEGYLRREETNGVILALAIRAAQACAHQGWVTPLPETLLFREPINAQRPPLTPGEQSNPIFFYFEENPCRRGLPDRRAERSRWKPPSLNSPTTFTQG